MERTYTYYDNKQYFLAEKSGLSKNTIETLAEQISENLEFGPEVSNEDIVELIGGKVSYDDLIDLEAKDGSIYIDDVSDFLIRLPLDTSFTKDRFTIAHELGHYYLHYLFHKNSTHDYPKIYATRYSSGETPRSEWEANWFASAFLMPKEQFTNVWNESKSIIALSDFFKVSISAAKIRAAKLELL